MAPMQLAPSRSIGTASTRAGRGRSARSARSVYSGSAEHVADVDRPPLAARRVRASLCRSGATSGTARRRSAARGVIVADRRRMCSSSPSKRKTTSRAGPAQPRPRARRWRRTPAATSVGELLMTFRISAVAVCRSSASLVSLNRRTFSIAITAWSAKVCSSAISAARERLHLRCAAARSRRSPRPRAASARSARCGSRSRACSSRTSGYSVVDQRDDVLDVQRRGARAPRGRRSRCGASGSVSSRVAHRVGRRRSSSSRAAVRRREQPDAAAVGPAQQAGALGDRVEHRLHVGRRAADHLAASRPSPSAARAPPCVSLNSRAFWIAITAWSAKVLSSAISLSAKPVAGSRGPTCSAPIALALAQHRRDQAERVVADLLRRCAAEHARHVVRRRARRRTWMHARSRIAGARRGAPSAAPARSRRIASRACRGSAASVQHALVVDQQDAVLGAREQRAGSSRGSSRTPAACRRPSC